MISKEEIRKILQPFSHTLRSTMAGSPEYVRALQECNAVIEHIFKRVGRVMHNGHELVAVEVLGGYNHILTYKAR